MAKTPEELRACNASAARRYRQKRGLNEDVRAKRRAGVKLWRERHPERARLIVMASVNKRAEYYKKKNRDLVLKSKFGITQATYDAMWSAQCGRCSICLKYLTKTHQNGAHIDHCHQTGKVRGILCGPCNRGLGMLQDNAMFMQRAWSYLQAV